MSNGTEQPALDVRKYPAGSRVSVETMADGRVMVVVTNSRATDKPVDRQTLRTQ